MTAGYSRDRLAILPLDRPNCIHLKNKLLGLFFWFLQDFCAGCEAATVTSLSHTGKSLCRYSCCIGEREFLQRLPLEKSCVIFLVNVLYFHLTEQAVLGRTPNLAILHSISRWQLQRTNCWGCLGVKHFWFPWLFCKMGQRSLLLCFIMCYNNTNNNSFRKRATD